MSSPIQFRITGWETERKSVDLKEALEQYTQDYLYVKGVVPGTIRGYDMMYRSIYKVHGNLDISKLTINDVYTWKKYHMDRGVSEGVLKGYQIKLRLLLRFHSRHLQLSIHPDDIVLPKSARKIPRIVTEAEAIMMYDKCDNFRDKLAIYLLWSTGVRVNELCHIRMRNIQENRIFIVGKGGKERYVFLDETALANLEIYRKSKIESEWLFPTIEKQMGNMPVQTNAIRELVKRVARKAGIKKRVTPHMFRHGFATQLMKNGMDIRYIQELMGHSFITTTQIYTHVNNTDLMKAFDKFHRVMI